MIVCALPPPSTTGWGVAGRRIVEELKKLTIVNDLNHVPTNGRVLTEDFPALFSDPFLTAIRGVDMLPMYLHIEAFHRVGYCFIEDNLLLRRYKRNAIRFWDVIACGSTWATKEMERTLPIQEMEIVTAIQGVDADIFCLNETIRPNPEWFTIFSGGKLEFRKAQDVVIRAVAVMMERHKDVRLAASWWNPWLESMQTMRHSRLITFPGVAPHFEEIINRNNIPRARVQFIEQSHHDKMPLVMAACDIGVFPNRCEAGTNLVLMEAMSCGMPVIATTSHGHADVTGHLTPACALSSKPFTVERSNGTEKMAVAKWYEPDLDELIGKLEWAYNYRQALPAEGLANREAMKQFTWERTAKVLLEACSL